MVMRLIVKIASRNGLLDRPFKLWTSLTGIYRLYLPVAGGFFVGALMLVFGINQGVNGFIEDQVDTAVAYVTPDVLNAHAFDKYRKSAPAAAAIAHQVETSYPSATHIASPLSNFIVDRLGHPQTVADLQDVLTAAHIDYAQIAASFVISDYVTGFVDARFIPIYAFLFFSIGFVLFQIPFIEMVIGCLLNKLFAPSPRVVTA